jgi:hypothetical protein
VVTPPAIRCARRNGSGKFPWSVHPDGGAVPTEIHHSSDSPAIRSPKHALADGADAAHLVQQLGERREACVRRVSLARARAQRRHLESALTRADVVPASGVPLARGTMRLMDLRIVVLAASSVACSAPVPTTATTHVDIGACKEIVVQCAYGGYSPNRHGEGRDILVDCLRPLESGATVRDVSLATATLHGCFGADLKDVEGRRIAEEMGAYAIGVDPR